MSARFRRGSSNPDFGLLGRISARIGPRNRLPLRPGGSHANVQPSISTSVINKQSFVSFVVRTCCGKTLLP
jgi:hypothetical protein